MDDRIDWLVLFGGILRGAFWTSWFFVKLGAALAITLATIAFVVYFAAA